jgi:hypothetical protein
MPDVLSGGRHYHLTGKIHSGGGVMGVRMNTNMFPAVHRGFCQYLFADLGAGKCL